MNLEQIEAKIHQYYRHFAEIAPGVVVQETGDIAALWALFDRATRNQMREMTLDDIVSEFGWSRAVEEGLVS